MESIIYNGPSMHPILKPGDILLVVPYEGQEVRRGDVIAFMPPGENAKVVHRVISVGCDGIRTRGDNNNQIDSGILSQEDILGRVVFLQRGNRLRSVFGGMMGCILSRVVRSFKTIDRRVSPRLRPLYYGLARHGILCRWVPSCLAPRVLSLDRPAGPELQLLMGGHVIGRKLPGREQWHIRRPFRLLVNEASLAELSVDHRPFSVVKMQNDNSGNG